MTDKKHYGIAQWVDFARGLAPDEDAAAMRDHAATCDECRKAVDFHSGLVQVAAGMDLFTVPDAVVQEARAIFPTRFPEQPKRTLRMAAELIYDSFLVPVPAGLRSTWQVGWQALYRAGDCSLDLRIEPELRSLRAAVIGQISNHIVPESRMCDLPVCLKSGRLVVAETRSNEFGEFQMEYEQQNRLQLCVYLDNGSKCIQVPLKRFTPEKPAGTERLNLGQVSNKKKTIPERKQ